MSDRLKVQRKKPASSDFTNLSLVAPTRGFNSQPETVSSQNIPLPQSHDISRISLRPQAKLTVSQPGDCYEQEADKVAQQVMSMGEPALSQKSIQRETIAQEEEEDLQMKPLSHLMTPVVQREEIPEEEEEELLQMKSSRNLAIQREEMPQEEEEEEIQTKPLLQSATDGNLQAGGNIESRLSSSKGGGSPLADDVRGFMEPRFGTDFRLVRVHTDDEAVQMNKELGAQAFAHGSDIYFGSGKSPGNNELTAHELTHVVQQSFGTNPSQSQLKANNLKVSQQSASTNLHGSWLSDNIGDLLNTRTNEDYLDAIEDLRSFSAKTHTINDYQPSSGRGMFDAEYSPTLGVLRITCKCTFNFVNGDAATYPSATSADLTWDDAAKEKWKNDFLFKIGTSWSGKHTFYCQKDWWESLFATVSVIFQEVDSGEHFKVDIVKIPSGASHTSGVTPPKPGLLWGYTPGQGDFDSNDLTSQSKAGGTQVPAVHEAGHMLGLGDEYGTGKVAHSDLVEGEFGHAVVRGSDSRIMSGGMDILPEHGVTFLEALKKATEMDEWSHSAKTAKPVPSSTSSSSSVTSGTSP